MNPYRRNKYIPKEEPNWKLELLQTFLTEHFFQDGRAPIHSFEMAVKEVARKHNLTEKEVLDRFCNQVSK